MEITFNSDIAKEVGVEEAIMLENLAYWIFKNKANNRHFHENTYWTYNSMHAFSLLFPFWSIRQISRILKKLEVNGYIITGNYNQTAYDRTKWYSLTKKATCILPYGEMENVNKTVSISPKGEMDTTKKSNGTTKKVQPIPNNKPNNKPNNIYISLFDFWNSQGIIKHKEFSTDIEKAIKNALKKYSEDVIKKAILVYAEILKNNEYFFSHKWSLVDFLKRKNGISTFMEDGSNYVNYIEWKGGKNNGGRFKGTSSSITKGSDTSTQQEQSRGTELNLTEEERKRIAELE